MKKSKWLQIKSLVLVLLFGALIVFMVKRAGVRAEAAADDAVQSAAKLQTKVDREGYAIVALVALIGLLTFITWTALRTGKGEDKATPSTGESNSHSRR